MFGITKQHLIGFIVAIIYWPYSLTFRYKLHYSSEYLEDKTNHLLAFWHQDDLALIPLFKLKSHAIMVSLSKDGRILATALRMFGYKIISGSSSRGGIAALISAIKMIRKGTSFAIAVDGPRGPAFQAKEGISVLATKSNKPIYPIKAFPKKYYMFSKAWNQPRLPLPFSRIDVVIGKPGNYDHNELTKVINNLHV